jgi:hypothetical protein
MRCESWSLSVRRLNPSRGSTTETNESVREEDAKVGLGRAHFRFVRPGLEASVSPTE